MLAECVVNVSEGRDPLVLVALADAAGACLLDLHADPEHHRSVVTLGGPLDAVEDAARAVTDVAVARLDLRTHQGLHPRLGVVDVVPFVGLPGHRAEDGKEGARAARDRFADWAAETHDLPCFLYGPERSLPDVRRNAFTLLVPDRGPHRPHPTAGATAAGARPVLVAYNVWIGPAPEAEGDATAVSAPDVARVLAAGLRGPAVHSLGFATRSGAQVSLNVIDPSAVSLADLYDDVAAGAASRGCTVHRAELVGLIPASALAAVPADRWPDLDLSPERTIEHRMEAAWGRAVDGR